MAKADVEHVQAFAYGVVSNWWQWTLVAIVVVSAAVGLLSLLWSLLGLWRQYRKTDHYATSLPHRVKDKLEHSAKANQSLSLRHGALPKPTSFGVYLGDLDIPLIEAQTRIFPEWDLVILDLKPSVGDAISTPGISLPEHVIGRLDLYHLLSPAAMSSEIQMVQSIDVILDTIEKTIRSTSNGCGFTGILLANWRDRISVPLLNGLVSCLNQRGLDIYLEVSPPNFLDGLKIPDLQLFAGIVVKNATILPNGDRRDFFQMDKMKSTTKAFVSQSCLRPFTVMMWETVDSCAELSHAVVKRSYSWSSYHGALCWIGSAASLTNLALSQPVLDPIPAFQWLKENRVMKLHENYRSTRFLSPRPLVSAATYQSLLEVFPSVQHIISAVKTNKSRSSLRASTGTLALETGIEFGDGSSSRTQSNEYVVSPNGQDWVSRVERMSGDPLSSSALGTDYTSFGCFPIGLNVTSEDFKKVVESQRRLKRLNLLDRLPVNQIREVGELLRHFLQTEPSAPQPIRDFCNLCCNVSDSDPANDPIQVFSCLDSGFHASATTQFWSVYEKDPATGALIVYLSKNARDIAGTLLHTYLSSKSVPRYQCFLAEFALGRSEIGPTHLEKLPGRMQQDLNLLSPADILLLLQQFKFSQFDEDCPLLMRIRAACEEILIDVPSFKQLKQLGNVGYLSGSVSDVELITSRVAWYCEHGGSHPDEDTALQIFRDVVRAFTYILEHRRYDYLDRVTSGLDLILRSLDDPQSPVKALDPYVDILAFSIFCAARKAAFDEVYVEVSDRNPLFNEYSDQSAAFAELFALGSRCDAYFDISPSAFGKLLSDRHREHYGKDENQPPMWIENAPAFASAYAAAQTDIDPDQKYESVPAFRRFTFLSVFAIPALIDIILLTTTGHGLYLSKAMSSSEKQNATIALMVSLLLSGAIGTWISTGGTYYLISMAFSAANVFVLTRLIGGIAFTVLGGLIGLIVIGAVEKFQSGVIFFFYLVVLTSYLSLLAALCSFQFPGSTFLNGRAIVIGIIPILLISPLITIFALNHDSVIYLTILYIFIICLVLGLRYVGSKWVTWISTIKTVDDAAVKKWYTETKAGGREDAFAGLSDPAAMSLSRQELYADVEAERRRPFWNKKTTDPLVRSLASCWDATVFLLDWYCRLSDVKRPMPYSSTWNIEVRVAYDSLLQNQKGIRLHNSFIHWRTAGDEIGCGVLYFVVALLDRWVELLYGQPLLGLSIGENDALRVAVGFGLAYYLIGAVLLDYKAQHLHQMAQGSSPVTITSSDTIRVATKYDAKLKRHLYWTTLCRFLGVHVWALALSTALVWILNATKESLFIFVAYVAAYSGLLLYQYNKIFSGPHALMPLLSAVAISLPLGLILKKFNQGFLYNNVIALAVATWTAALLSFHTAKIGMPKKTRSRKSDVSRTYYAYGGLGFDHEWSQSELESFYEGLLSESPEQRFRIRPEGHPGVEIKARLLSCDYGSLSRLAQDAFPAAPYWIKRLISAWEKDSIVVELVSMGSVIKREADIRALSCSTGGQLHILIASDSDRSGLQEFDITSNCRVIAETILHACTESIFDLRHDHASIAESLLICAETGDTDQLSECLKRSTPLDVSQSRVLSLAVSSRRELLQNICLGLPCETTWDNLPLEIRRAFIKRCRGEHVVFSPTELDWLHSNIHAETGCDLATKIARYDLGAVLAAQKMNYFKRQGPLRFDEKAYRQEAADIHYYQDKATRRSAKSLLQSIISYIKGPFVRTYHGMGIWVKFLVIAVMADPEYQRELDCVLKNTSPIIAKPITFFLTGLWMYARMVQAAVLPLFLYGGRKDLRALMNNIRGTYISLKKGRLVIRSLDKTETAFIHAIPNGSFRLHFYPGTPTTEPDPNTMTRISIFSKEMRLLSRLEYSKGNLVNEYVYEYPSKRSKRLSKVARTGNPAIPLSRICVRGQDEAWVVQYNHKGFIESGSYMLHGNLIRFKYHYRKSAKHDDELLRAEFVLPHMSVNVSWAAPPIRHPEKTERWIPHSRVNEATFVRGSDVYESVWIYNHQFHPTISTMLNGQIVETPDMIKHDWLGLLKKPTRCTFVNDNPLLDFRSIESGFLTRLLHLNSRRLPTSTSNARSQLWKAWKKRSDLDGVVIRWLDEQLLRADPLLSPYWRRRDRCSLIKAEDYLALHADTVSASAELTNDIAAWTPLAIRMSDLFSFGQGGDAVVYTRTKTLQPDAEDTLHVVAVDTGTWPNEGGGVSACRRDMINNLRTIKWHMVVESANDFGLPKHQTEENVESLKVIPLWGLDFMHPVHGMFFNKLDSEVDRDVKSATIDDIRRNFIPTLTALVKGARAVNISPADVKQATRALVNLNTYFQDSRHWKEVWTSDTVKESWRHLWLADDLPNTKPPSEWFDTEHPTLGHLDTALELWFRYLFIFSIPIPEKIPSVFQASHHSVSAAYGIVCKVKRHSTLQIWDHAISWRETNLYLSSALCTMPPFIRNSLLGLMRLTSMLVLHHADNILPCADFFNPGWEVEIGTSQGTIQHRNTFRRKIDPVVNGITDMEKFAPVSEIKTKKPTVTMLSHVWFAKDIKTALLAADIIVNEWKFKDYQLDIYGALNKAPIYSSECQEIIATKGIGTNVSLRGTADPGLVLSNTWLFLNSSVSEGLPLALGEAALTGAPVVCTDVGASLRVLTDPESGERYSEIVAPNDPYSLARAQINMLAMIDQWAKYAEDEPGHPVPVLPVKPTPRDVEIITQRMYDKDKQRRALGMMARNIVQNSFSGDRYLREHEQMLWVGKARYEMLGLPTPPPSAHGEDGFDEKDPRTYADVVDQQLGKMQHPRPPWLRNRRSSVATSFTSIYDSPRDSLRGSKRSSYAQPHRWSILPPPSRGSDSSGLLQPSSYSRLAPSPDGTLGRSSGGSFDSDFEMVQMSEKGKARTPSPRALSPTPRPSSSLAPSRPSLTARLSDQEGRLSRMSARSSRHIPTMLSEVQNAEYP